MQEVVKNNNELMTIKETDSKTSDPFLDQAMAAAIKSTESAQLSKSEADRAKREADRAEQEATGAEQAQRSASNSAVSAMESSAESRSVLVAAQKIQVQVDASKNEVNQVKTAVNQAKTAAEASQAAALESENQARANSGAALKSAQKSQEFSKVSEAAQNVTIAARDQAVIIREDIKQDKAAVSTSQQQAEQAQRAARLSQQAAHDSEVATLGSKNAAFKSEQSAFNSMEQAQAAAKGSAETAAASKGDADRAKVEADRTQGQAAKAEAAKIAAKDSQYKAKESELLIMGNIDQAEQSKIWAGKYADNAKASEQKALDAINGVIIKDDYDHGMTKATFFALAEKRKRDSAGSGFLEWGKHAGGAINQSLWTFISTAYPTNTLHLGRNVINSEFGISRLNFPLAIVNGVVHQIETTGNSSGNDAGNLIKFPPAPDGTKTYDSATGEVIQHLDAETAFAAETETNKVIITRKDFVFLETWLERLSTHDLFNPLGNSQFWAGSWEGLTLKNDLVPQGYSAFGEWDTETIGYGFKWSTLTAAQRKKVLSDPRNNIYLDPEINDYIQVKYRIRVVEGLGNNWECIRQNYQAGSHSKFVGYAKEKAFGKVVAKGQTTDNTDDLGYRNKVVFNTPNTFDVVTFTGDAGRFTTYNGNSTISSNNSVNMIPIALVQRLNQGAYHPVWNSAGCSSFWVGTRGDVGRWNQLTPSKQPLTTKDCFIFTPWSSPTKVGTPCSYGETIYFPSGQITLNKSGRPASDPYKFYDAIYAGLVEDLRLSANKQDYNRLLEDSIKKAVKGETRGKGSVYISKSVQTSGSARISDNFGLLPTGENKKYSIGDLLTGIDSDGLAFKDEIKLVAGSSVFTKNKHKQRENMKVFISKLLAPQYNILPQCDLIGSPEAIAATFPEGVAGSWLPTIPDGTSKEFALTRKNSGSTITRVYSDDNGATWTTAAENINQTKNSFTANLPASRVELWNYSSPSNFTEPANNSQVLSMGDVVFTNSLYLSRGARLCETLTGGIPKNSFGTNYFIEKTLSKTTSNNILGFDQNSLPTHVPCSRFKISSIIDTAAVKTLYTLTSKDGLLYMQYHGQELKYKDGAANPWGDTVAGTEYTAPHGVIPIVNGEGTKQDLNGQTVKTFCHHELIPIGIADATESANAQTLAVNEAVTLPVYPHPDDNGEAPEQGQVLPMNQAETLPLE